MSKETFPLFQSISQRLLLCILVPVLIFLLSFWAFFGDKLLAAVDKDADTLGMDVYFARSPFTLFVSKTFPKNKTFTLLQDGQPLGISVVDSSKDGSDTEKKVTVVIGQDFSFSCKYSVAEGVQVHDLLLSRQNENLLDLNADGHYDMRIPFPCDAKHLVQIRYQGKWQDVVAVDDSKSDKYHKKLVTTGELISFNMNTGQWLSAGDAPSQKDAKTQNENKQSDLPPSNGRHRN